MAAGRASGRQDCRRRASSSLSSSCGGRLVVGDVVHPLLPRRLVVGDVALRFGGAELSSVGNYSLPVVVGAGLGESSSLQGSASFVVIVSWLSSFGRAWSGSAASRGG